MLLNTAYNVKLGTKQVERIYRGTSLVWQHEIPVVATLTPQRTQANTGEPVLMTVTTVPANAEGMVRIRRGSTSGQIVGEDTAAPWEVMVTMTSDATYYAEFVGNYPYLNDFSEGVFINVAGATTINLTSNQPTISPGQTVTLTATVPGVTTGAVAFRTGSPTGPVLATVNNSPWTLPVNPSADTTYYAEYLPNTENMGAMSNALFLDYVIPTSVSLSASKTSVNQGEATVLTATVSGVSAGTVNFRSGSPTGPVVATDNSAPWSVSIVPTADTTYFAEYVGSGDYAKSVSTGVAVNFSIPTSISLSANKGSATTNEAVTLTATVGGASTGTVYFYYSNNSGASWNLIGSDSASPWTISHTPNQNVHYYAEFYGPTGDYIASGSNTPYLDYYISTSISISGEQWINNGQTATISASLSGVGSGVVDFYRSDGAHVGGVAGPPYNLGVAPGGHTAYYARYNGSGDYLASQSGNITVYVRQLVTKTWGGYATWYQCYNGSGNQKSGDMYYGYYSSTNGNQRSMFGFDMPDFRGVVAVTGVRIKFYNSHHFQNSGGSIPVGLHEAGGKPGTYCCAYENLQVLGNAPKPGWVDNWMNGNFTARVKASLIKGFTLGPGPSTSTSYYGTATGDSPYMEVQYQVWE